MTQQESGYKTVYARCILNESGEYVRHQTRIHEHAKQYGYWRFAKGQNSHAARAFELGFRDPEQLLTSYNHGNDGPLDSEIKLAWIPGETDPYGKPLVATVGTHMAEIARARASLGLPPLLAHEIPTYPIRSHGLANQPETGRGSAPPASAIQNLLPPDHTSAPGGIAPMLPARNASPLSIFQQNHIWGGTTDIIPAPQAHNALLAAHNQARTAALVANRHSTAGDVVPDQTTVNIPLHGQIAQQIHADQSRAIQQHRNWGSRATAATSSSPNIRLDTLRTTSSSRSFTSDTPLTRPVETFDSANAPDTPSVWSNEIAGPSQSRVQHIPIHVARSLQLDQLLQGFSNQLGPPQPNAALSSSPLTSHRGSSTGAEHLPSSPASPCSSPGESSLANTTSLDESQLHLHTLLLQTQGYPQDMSENASREVSVNDTTSTPPTDATHEQDLEMMMDSFNSTDTEATSASALAGSDHDLAAMQTWHKISNGITEIRTDPSPPTAIVYEDHRLRDQQPNVGSRPLNANTLSVPHSSTTPVQGLNRTQIPCEETNTEADSAVAIHHHDLRSKDSRQADSPIVPDVSSDSTSSSTSADQDHSVRQQTPSETGAEESEIEVRYDPHDEFTTALLPLSANVPCMICQGTKKHDPYCMVAGFQSAPVPAYNEVMLETLRKQVERLDPEQWRQHSNPPSPPEPESIHEVLPGLNRIIKNERSYKHNPVLHEISDQQLPLMWAMYTSEKTGIHLINAEGELYDPNHPIWTEGKYEDDAEAMIGSEVDLQDQRR